MSIEQPITVTIDVAWATRCRACGVKVSRDERVYAGAREASDVAGDRVLLIVDVLCEACAGRFLSGGAAKR